MTGSGMELDDALDPEVTGDDYAPDALAWIRTVVGGVMGDPAGWDEKFVPFLTASWRIICRRTSALPIVNGLDEMLINTSAP